MITFSVEEKTLLGIGIVNIAFLLVFIIHFTVVYCLSKKKRVSLSDGIDLGKVGENQNSKLNDGGIGLEKKRFRYIEYKSKRNLVALHIESVMAMVIFQLLILVLVMFDKLHIAAGIFIMFLVILWYWVSWFIPSSDEILKSTLDCSCALKKYGKRMVDKVKLKNIKRNYRYWIMLLPALIIILILTIVLEGTCEDELVFIDSRIMRKYMTPTCDDSGKPCFTYLTLNQRPDISIIANFHISLPKDKKSSPPTPICFYDTISRSINATSTLDLIKDYSFNSTGNYFEMPIEVIRYVNWVHLEGLKPSTYYYFRCGNLDYGFSDERKFKTQTDSQDDGYSFVVGGDIDVTEDAIRISEIAAKQEPNFAMVGGDLAYDHAQYACYRIVDRWLQNWQSKMITPNGTTVPIIASIGNHEVIGDYNAGNDRIPFFLRYFPQFTKSLDPGTGVNVDTRSSFNTVSIGGPNGTVIFNLDSGHHSSTSDQANWMRTTLESKEFSGTSLRFSLYHVPMYPTIREYENPKSLALRETWLPVFDTYHFNIGFENHDHAYKRTHPLNNDKIANSTSKGTVYLGDGAWGTSIRSLPSASLKWYQSFSKSTHYISYISVNNDKTITFKSINTDEEVFDQGSINY